MTFRIPSAALRLALAAFFIGAFAAPSSAQRRQGIFDRRDKSEDALEDALKQVDKVKEAAQRSGRSSELNDALDALERARQRRRELNGMDAAEREQRLNAEKLRQAAEAAKERERKGPDPDMLKREQAELQKLAESKASASPEASALIKADEARQDAPSRLVAAEGVPSEPRPAAAGAAAEAGSAAATAQTPAPKPEPELKRDENGVPIPLPPKRVPLDRKEGKVEHVVITAQGPGFFDAAKKVVLYNDDVKVDHPEFKLASDRLEVFFEEDAMGSEKPARTKDPVEGERDSGGIKTAIASGSVVTIEKEDEDGEPQIARSRRARYDGRTGDLTLTEWPEIERKGQLVKATSSETVFVITASGKPNFKGPHRFAPVPEKESQSSSRAPADFFTAASAALFAQLEAPGATEGAAGANSGSEAPAPPPSLPPELLPAPEGTPAPRPPRHVPLVKPTKAEKVKINAAGDCFFDAGSKIVIFTDDVLVLHPDFTINSDRLELFLADELVGKDDGEPAKDGAAPGEPPAAPSPPPAGNPPPGEAPANEDPGIDSGGIKMAVAEGAMVRIEKADENGNPQIALCRWAKYDAETGDITMRVWPQIQRGEQLIRATSEATRFIIKPNGSLETFGPIETDLRRKPEKKPKATTAAGPAAPGDAPANPQ